jgi:hypothetical protein
VKRKLANGLLSNLEDYAAKVADDFPGGTDEEFLIWLQNSLNKAILPKPPDRNFKIFMKKLSEDIRSINSELMFAALSNYNDYKVSFDTFPGPDHDFDFLINSLPVQVKTFNPSEDREKSIKKIEEFETNQSLDPRQMEKVIFDFLLNLTPLDEMEKAVDQGALIIFSNMSNIYIGHTIRKFLAKTNLTLPLENAVSYSVNIASNNYKTTLPLIVCVSGTDYNFQLFALYFQIPVTMENNKLKLDRGRMQGFSL